MGLPRDYGFCAEEKENKDAEVPDMKRKTGMRRIAAYLLALVFMLAFLPDAGAESPAEEPSDEETLADQMTHRRGLPLRQNHRS